MDGPKGNGNFWFPLSLSELNFANKEETEAWRGGAPNVIRKV